MFPGQQNPRAFEGEAHYYYCTGEIMNLSTAAFCPSMGVGLSLFLFPANGTVRLSGPEAVTHGRQEHMYV